MQARNASERRAGLEKGNVEADPPELRGRPPGGDPQPSLGQQGGNLPVGIGHGWAMNFVDNDRQNPSSTPLLSTDNFAIGNGGERLPEEQVD